MRIREKARNMKSRLEIFLIYMFAFGAANGIAGALGLFFASDAVAEATGSPFQLEMGFANLTMGVLAVKAVTRRDGFREATVIGEAVLGVGTFVVHIIDIAQHGNLAPGNTIINITNLGEPALLIYFLRALRKVERSTESKKDSKEFIHWQSTGAALGGTTDTGVGVGLGTGLATGLYLTGHWTQPGSGVWTVVLSGINAARCVLGKKMS